MADEQEDKGFVEYVVKSIVDHPDDVVVERSLDERGVLLTLKLHQEDMGYVIGRQGQTARAIRTLLRVVGSRNNARLNLKIEEPEGSTRGRRDDRRDDRREEREDTSVVDDLKI